MNMSSDLKQRLGELATQFVRIAMNSGATWDEAVAAMGLASKALSDTAAKNGDGTLDDCAAHAHKRFGEGMAQEVTMVFAMSDSDAIRKAGYDSDPDLVDAIRSNTNTNIMFKH